jgi:hypothetical protein
VLRITGGRTVVRGSAAEIAEARERFARCGYLKIPGLIEGRLLEAVLAALDGAAFYDRVHDGIGVELCVRPGAVSGALEFLMNDPALLEAVAGLARCGPIGCFEGRAYRMVPGTAHHDSWHSDVGEDRLVAMSVNLGREPYQGGVLQIRRADSPGVIAEVHNRAAGDAVLFRIDPAFRHRVGPLHGRVPRTAYAGWFRARPDFRPLLRERLARGSG